VLGKLRAAFRIGLMKGQINLDCEFLPSLATENLATARTT
jgi:hypothetical protein